MNAMEEEHQQEYDPARFAALEETVFATAHALETLMQLMIEKGFFTETELEQKMDELAEHEDIEEVNYDADAPRDQDDD